MTHPAIIAMEGPPFSGLDDALGADVDDTRNPSDVLRAVIQFANSEVTPHWWTRAREAQAGLWLVTNDDGETEAVDHDVARAVAEHQIEMERAFAAEVLDRAVEGAGPLVRRLRAARQAGLRIRVRMEPSIQFTSGGGLRLRWNLTGPTGDSRGWALFAGALLAEQANNDKTELGRCRLESCRRFFLVERRGVGAPQTKYCCEEHRLEAHSLGAADRQRRSRAARKDRARQPRRAR